MTTAPHTTHFMALTSPRQITTYPFPQLVTELQNSPLRSWRFRHTKPAWRSAMSVAVADVVVRGAVSCTKEPELAGKIGEASL